MQRTLVRFARMVALDANGGHVGIVSERQSSRAMGFGLPRRRGDRLNGAKPGQVLMTRVRARDDHRTHLAQTDEGLGVESVDVVSLQRRTVEHGRADAGGYITDGLGHVRLMEQLAVNSTGYDTGRSVWLYRRWGIRLAVPGPQRCQRWYWLARLRAQAVDPTLDAVYGFDDGGAGHIALYRIKLDGSLARERVLWRSDVDVDELLTIGRNHRVVGVSYATEKRVVEFFDPALKALAAALHKALPGQPQISFEDASADESRLLLLAGGDTDPGTYYVFDKATRHLERCCRSGPNSMACRSRR
jgi:hypothetical protein